MALRTRFGRLLSARGISVFAVVSALTLAGLFVTLSAPPARAQITTNVSIKNYTFNPGNITVVIGVNNTVTWTNHDSVAHFVKGNDGSWGGGVAAGATYTHTFNTTGVFAYHCAIHPYMQGGVKVLGPSTSTGQSSGVPEFPIAGVGILVLTAFLVAAYFATRKTLGSRNSLTA